MEKEKGADRERNGATDEEENWPRTKRKISHG
jgi:hypothetical protein